MQRLAVLVCLVSCLCSLSSAMGEPIKLSTIMNTSEPSSVEVMKLFRQKVASQAGLFRLGHNIDPSNGLLFMEDCLPRRTAEPYVCFYTTHYVGGTTKTLMGGGIYVAKTAADIAENFVSSLAQDIAVRWNNTMRSNAIETLEACLFLTQSSCAVPETLQLELKTKVLKLSQYLQRGTLRK